LARRDRLGEALKLIAEEWRELKARRRLTPQGVNLLTGFAIAICFLTKVNGQALAKGVFAQRDTVLCLRNFALLLALNFFFFVFTLPWYFRESRRRTKGLR